MEFPRQEYWSGKPFPPPGDLPDPRIEPGSPALQVNPLPFEWPGKPEGKSKGICSKGSKRCKNAVNACITWVHRACTHVRVPLFMYLPLYIHVPYTLAYQLLRWPRHTHQVSWLTPRLWLPPSPDTSDNEQSRPSSRSYVHRPCSDTVHPEESIRSPL